MSVSTDAILFYGYCWNEEDLELVEGEWEEVILKKRGEVNPWDSMPKDLEEYLPGETYAGKRARGDAWIGKYRKEIDEWHEKKEKVRKEFGVDRCFHCSGGCSMPYIAVKEVGVTANRGYPEAIDPSMFAIQPEWKDKLDRFMKELGIEKPQPEPQWWLVSWWC